MKPETPRQETLSRKVISMLATCIYTLNKFGFDVYANGGYSISSSEDELDLFINHPDVFDAREAGVSLEHLHRYESARGGSCAALTKKGEKCKNPNLLHQGIAPAQFIPGIHDRCIIHTDLIAVKNHILSNIGELSDRMMSLGEWAFTLNLPTSVFKKCIERLMRQNVINAIAGKRNTKKFLINFKGQSADMGFSSSEQPPAKASKGSNN